MCKYLIFFVHASRGPGECLTRPGAKPLVAERAFPTSDYWGRTGVGRCAEEMTGICRDSNRLLTAVRRQGSHILPFFRRSVWATTMKAVRGTVATKGIFDQGPRFLGPFPLRGHRFPLRGDPFPLRASFNSLSV